MALISCPECGKKVSDTSKTCVHCGFDLSNINVEKEQVKGVSDETNIISNTKNKMDKKKFIWIGIAVGILVIGLIIFFVIKGINDKKEYEASKAIKVDITMNSWYGAIDYILDDFGIEFYAVTSGANCYSGTKTNQFETEKYGILYTEFTYCKSNKIQRLRVYNKSSDQPLRNAEPGELIKYDSYGDRISNSYY